MCFSIAVVKITISSPTLSECYTIKGCCDQSYSICIRKAAFKWVISTSVKHCQNKLKKKQKKHVHKHTHTHLLALEQNPIWIASNSACVTSNQLQPIWIEERLHDEKMHGMSERGLNWRMKVNRKSRAVQFKQRKKPQPWRRKKGEESSWKERWASFVGSMESWRSGMKRKMKKSL